MRSSGNYRLLPSSGLRSVDRRSGSWVIWSYLVAGHLVTAPILGAVLFLPQAYCSHRISPHRGEFATFAKTVAIRGDFMLKCGKWRILLDKR